MSTDLIIGLVSCVLAVSLVANGALLYGRKLVTAAWSARWREAEDRANAAQVRSAEQIDAMLDRVATSERLELRDPTPEPPDATERAYISDFPYEDEAWNDLRTSTTKDPE